MINMGPKRGRGVGVRMGFPKAECLTPKDQKFLVVLALFGALLASGHALESPAPAAGADASAGVGTPAAISKTASAEPGALFPATVSDMASGENGAPPASIAPKTAPRGPDALPPARPALPGKIRNALLGIMALGMMALGAAMARLIGGDLPDRVPLGGFRIHFGFFRHAFDRAFGRASGSRDGRRSA